MKKISLILLVSLAARLDVSAAEVFEADLNALDLDRNPKVVTNVSFSGLVDLDQLEASISTNNQAFVSAVTNCPVVVVGQEDVEWGTYGTLGALLAAIVAAIKLAKSAAQEAKAIAQTADAAAQVASATAQEANAIAHEADSTAQVASATAQKANAIAHEADSTAQVASATAQDAINVANNAASGLQGKASKVANATAGNLAALDAQGNLVDSGAKVSNFATPTDLPYALVTPGEWEFSEPQGLTNFTVTLVEYYDGYWTLYYTSDETTSDAASSPGNETDLSVTFRVGLSGESVITATRPSLPGHLLDRAVNAVPVSSATEITLPEKIAGGKSRDFYARLSVRAESAVTFAATDSGGDAVAWDSMGDPSDTLAVGTYLYRFTEVADGVFHAADITNGGSIDPAVLDEKLDASSAAPPFSESLTYLVGEYVTYGGVLYRCKTAVTTAGAWTGTSNWEVDDMTSPDATLDIMSDGRLRVVTVAGEDLWMQGYDLQSTSAQVLKCEKVNLLKFSATTAEAFDSTATYAVGDRVIYGGVVYKFTAAHSAGAWIGTDAAVDSVSLTMPYVPVGKVGDFVLDVDNSANASVKMAAELSGLFTAFDVFVDKGRNLSDLLTFDGGEQCELYFTMTAFGTQAKPAWKVVKQVVEKQEAGS